MRHREFFLQALNNQLQPYLNLGMPSTNPIVTQPINLDYYNFSPYPVSGGMVIQPIVPLYFTPVYIPPTMYSTPVDIPQTILENVPAYRGGLNNVNQDESKDLLNFKNHKNDNNGLPSPEKIIEKNKVLPNVSEEEKYRLKYEKAMESLKTYAQKTHQNWKKIAKLMIRDGYERRTPAFWKFMFNNYPKPPWLVKIKYDKQEIQDIKNYVIQYGVDWKKIAELMGIDPIRVKNCYYQKIYNKQDKPKDLDGRRKKTKFSFFSAHDREQQPPVLFVEPELTELKILNESDTLVLKL